MVAGQDSAQAVAEVVARNILRYEAMQSGDTATLASILADDFLYVHSTGRVDSRQDMLDRLSSGSIRYLRVEPKPLGAALLKADLCRIFERVVLTVETVSGVARYDSLVISHWSQIGDWQARTIQSSARSQE